MAHIPKTNYGAQLAFFSALADVPTRSPFLPNSFHAIASLHPYIFAGANAVETLHESKSGTKFSTLVAATLSRASYAGRPTGQYWS